MPHCASVVHRRVQRPPGYAVRHIAAEPSLAQSALVEQPAPGLACTSLDETSGRGVSTRLASDGGGAASGAVKNTSVLPSNTTARLPHATIGETIATHTRRFIVFTPVCSDEDSPTRGRTHARE
jgi:hypothetical protein